MTEAADDPRPDPLPPGPLGGYWRIAVMGVLGFATIVLHLLPGAGSLNAVRGGVTLAFMAAGPGMALMGLLRLDDLLLELSLALALSLVIETILAMAMLILRWWQPSGGLMIIEALTALGALGQVYQLQKGKHRPSHHPAITGP